MSFPGPRAGFASLLCGIALVGPPDSAAASELSSASFRMRGAHASAAGTASLESTAAQPRFGTGGASLGQRETLGFAQAIPPSTTSAPGFWPLVAGGFATLDPDQDGIPAWLDPDEDQDGLPDGSETGTHLFVSAADTGTDPLDPDSDGDGQPDGSEVDAGTDPNDPLSYLLAQVPALPLPALLGLSLCLVAGARLLRGRAEESTR